MSASASFEAIGVLNQVTVDEASALDEALRIATSEVAALDLACSRFRDDSELSHLNRSGGGTFEVSRLLFDALEAAVRAASATGGLVDPTVGSSLSALGWDRDFAQVLIRPHAVKPFELVPAAGWRAVRLDAQSRSVRIPAGVELDVGATAKAFAADRIAARIASVTGAGVLVSLGGDLAVDGAPSGGWPVLVTDDHRRGTQGQVVAIRGGGLATSSTSVRRWRYGGRELHHIVDPSTGAPAHEHWHTVSVAAATCLDANTASTAAVLRGPDAPAWLEARGLPSRLVASDGAVVQVAGWPAEEIAA
ncbi:MAG TPA: FAD:protein FMN transferase [Gaiellaceae bacterium]